MSFRESSIGRKSKSWSDLFPKRCIRAASKTERERTTNENDWKESTRYKPHVSRMRCGALEDEDKDGEIIVGGTDAGNTPFCTFYSGSTGECFDESVLGENGENGSRDLLFSKKEKRVTDLEAKLEKMSWTEHKKIQTEQKRANTRTRKQWCQAKGKLCWD